MRSASKSANRYLVKGAKLRPTRKSKPILMMNFLTTTLRFRLPIYAELLARAVRWPMRRPQEAIPVGLWACSPVAQRNSAAQLSLKSNARTRLGNAI
jgi:hypothetical protein